jgi:multicomponent Na+:H+ antiporter subunit F
MDTKAIGAFPVVASLVLLMLSVALILAFIRLVRGPSLPDRVVALDLIAILSVGIIADYDIATNDTVFLDVAVVLALIAFLGTVAFARYVERGAPRGPSREASKGKME